MAARAGATDDVLWARADLLLFGGAEERHTV
jgi:hypothetical protein